jgi:uncharacterized cupredoxin-like copper-binding protein
LPRHVSALLGTAVVALAVWQLGVASAASPKATVIKVIAGADSGSAFEVSPFSLLPPGPFTFKVKNAGSVDHDFVLCISPVATAARNSCVGYESKDLLPGESTSISIGHIPKGTYEFLSSDPGDAAGGMKGLLGVGVAVKGPKPVAKPKPASKPKTSTGTTAPSSTTPATSVGTSPDGTVTPPPDTGGGGYICKQGGLVQGVSTPQDCQFPSSG